MRKLYQLFALLAFVCTFAACSDSKDEPEPTPDPSPIPGALLSINGYAELGAFSHDSKITFYPLNQDLERTKDEEYSDVILSDLGVFSIRDRMILKEVFFEVEVTGNFFNGIKAAHSDNQVTMHAINHVGTPFTIERMISQVQHQLPPTNINILTQLTAARICTLLKQDPNDKVSTTSLEFFQKASKQAMKELMDAFSIDYEVETGTNISLLDFNEKSGMMAAITAVILEGVGEDFLNNFFTEWDKDFAENGRIDNDMIMETIRNGQQAVESIKMKQNLQTFYAAYKENVSFPDFWQFIDRNGDGVIDEQDKPESSGITDSELTPSEQECIAILGQINKDFRAYLQTESVWEANFCGAIEPIPGYPTTLTPETSEVYDIWASAYKAIRQCNELIHLLSTKEYDYNVKPYIGTIYTVQSQIYLSLTQLFGDVPYMTPKNFNSIADINKLHRTPVKMIYDGQLKALDEYGRYLPPLTDVQNKYFTNSFALQLLIANMYIEMGKYDFVANFLDGSNNYYLNPYIWKVDNSELTEENKPLYNQYIGDAYHTIYHRNLCDLLRAESYLAFDNRAKAFEALKRIDSNIQVDSNDGEALRTCLLEYGKMYMGKSFGYFATLKRMGVAKEMLQLKDYQLLLPIPLRETQQAPGITQNPGYDKKD